MGIDHEAQTDEITAEVGDVATTVRYATEPRVVVPATPSQNAVRICRGTRRVGLRTATIYKKMGIYDTNVIYFFSIHKIVNTFLLVFLYSCMAGKNRPGIEVAQRS